jgi:hypothetical protein
VTRGERLGLGVLELLLRAAVPGADSAMACGGGKEQLDELESPVQPGVPVAMAFGGGKVAA